MARGTHRKPCEGLADCILPTMRDVKAFGLGLSCSRQRIPSLTAFRLCKFTAQQPTEGRRGIEGLPRQPGFIGSIGEPTVQPEIIGCRLNAGEVKLPRQYLRDDLAQAGADVVTVRSCSSFP